MGQEGVNGSDVGKAFGLVILAGACTGLGGLTVFWGKLNRLWLGGSLGVAAGVMLYIALVDIYSTVAMDHFRAAGLPDSQAFAYATLCFIGGFPCVAAIDKLSDWILATAERRAAARAAADRADSGAPNGPDTQQPAPALSTVTCTAAVDTSVLDMGGKGTTEPASKLHPEPCCSCDLESQSVMTPTTTDVCCKACGNAEMGAIVEARTEAEDQIMRDALLSGHESRLLLHTSLLTGVALAVHNLPEGIVTFTGYMSSPNTGYAIVIAVALHNIPEGMVVAMPVMYATGSRARAIFWACLSGAVEPLGGLIGVAIVYGNGVRDEALGVIMGLVAGIMVFISLRELIPKALQFDPEDKVVTWSVLAGMVVMAASLVLLGFMG